MPFPFPQANDTEHRFNVFNFFTTLYRRDTLQLSYRIEHNSPIHRQFGKVFA